MSQTADSEKLNYIVATVWTGTNNNSTTTRLEMCHVEAGSSDEALGAAMVKCMKLFKSEGNGHLSLSLWQMATVESPVRQMAKDALERMKDPS